jgi:hypothetical protein
MWETVLQITFRWGNYLTGMTMTISVEWTANDIEEKFRGINWGTILASRNRDNAVAIEIGYGLDDGGVGVRLTLK